LEPLPTGLVVASNRLPVVVETHDDGALEVAPATGGLVTALLPVLRARGGTWVGWPGIAGGDDAAIARELDTFTAGERFDFAPVPLSAEEVAGFYHGFCNEVVWPLFHDLVSHCVFDPAYWGAYQAVNRRFAAEIARHARPHDLVWVQDYHLMDVAAELRFMGLANRIGFFLHVPFPAPDIFLRLPWRTQILDALLAFDQLGFQTANDRGNFLACAERLAGPVSRTPDPCGVRLRSGQAACNEVVASALPISIDFEDFAGRAASAEVARIAAELRAAFQDRHLVLGVDRLDYSKGLPQKLAAFRLALERDPDVHRKVVLVQHVVPSRESVADYRRLRLEVERLVGEINGQFSQPGWVPVHYYYHSLERDPLLAWYRAADTALITALKDGMNLVAKEYCACHVDGRGTLILSEFAGTAAELGEHALLVNPFDVEGVADAIRRAWKMDAGEQALRMQAMRRIVRKHDVHRWAERCLAAGARDHDRARPAGATAASSLAHSA